MVILGAEHLEVLIELLWMPVVLGLENRNKINSSFIHWPRELKGQTRKFYTLPSQKNMTKEKIKCSIHQPTTETQ